jgi:hypothetical protein
MQNSKTIKHSNLVTKSKPFKKLFKGKTTLRQSNTGNQSTIEDLIIHQFILTKPL